MSTLAEQIAREHVLYRATEGGGKGIYGQPLEVYVGYACECGWATTNSWDTTLHIATVTEQAVVDRLEALAREIDDLTITHQAENYATVLRIKREGVMEAIRRLKGDADD